MKKTAVVFAVLALVLAVGQTSIYAHSGHSGEMGGGMDSDQSGNMSEAMSDLKKVEAENLVSTLAYCKGIYTVTTKSGKTRDFKEFDLRFKTDSSNLGPAKGKPALVNSGMQGDRAFIIFHSLQELKTFPKANKGCKK